MPLPSSSHTSRRSVWALMPGEAVTAIVSQRAARAAAIAPVSGPRAGTPPGVVSPSPPGTQAPTTANPAHGSRASTRARWSTCSASPMASTRWMARPRARSRCSRLRATYRPRVSSASPTPHEIPRNARDSGTFNAKQITATVANSLVLATNTRRSSVGPAPKIRGS